VAAQISFGFGFGLGFDGVHGHVWCAPALTGSGGGGGGSGGGHAIVTRGVLAVGPPLLATLPAVLDALRHARLSGFRGFRV
jgi:hypothetical protein